MSQQLDQIPWYKQFWPWFIMVPPATAIVASSITIWLAMTNAPDLVVPDYGKIGETVALDIRLAESADLLGLRATVQLDQLDGSNNRSVSVLLSQNTESAVLSGQILLRLVHPTVPEFDRNVLLVLDGDRYRGSVDLAAAKYLLQLEDLDTSWRLSTMITDRSNAIIIGE
jgi:hypothetical protein